MNDLNTLLVPWTIDRTAKSFPTPEIRARGRAGDARSQGLKRPCCGGAWCVASRAASRAP